MAEITTNRLEELEEAEKKLHALENNGVDNWEWYDEAIQEYQQWKERKKTFQRVSIEIQEELTYHIEEPAGRDAGYGFSPEVDELIIEILKDNFKVKQ